MSFLLYCKGHFFFPLVIPPFVRRLSRRTSPPPVKKQRAPLPFVAPAGPCRPRRSGRRSAPLLHPHPAAATSLPPATLSRLPIRVPGRAAASFLAAGPPHPRRIRAVRAVSAAPSPALSSPGRRSIPGAAPLLRPSRRSASPTTVTAVHAALPICVPGSPLRAANGTPLCTPANPDRFWS